MGVWGGCRRCCPLAVGIPVRSQAPNIRHQQHLEKLRSSRSLRTLRPKPQTNILCYSLDLKHASLPKVGNERIKNCIFVIKKRSLIENWYRRNGQNSRYAYIHTYIHTCIRTYTHTHTCMHTYIYTHMPACMHIATISTFFG